VFWLALIGTVAFYLLAVLPGLTVNWWILLGVAVLAAAATGAKVGRLALIAYWAFNALVSLVILPVALDVRHVGLLLIAIITLKVVLSSSFRPPRRSAEQGNSPISGSGEQVT